MMNIPMFSIIMPVYNAEKYICKSINSILSQSYQNFELILINDGSTDRSGFICEQFQNKDARISVIHKKNGGPSSSRNCGLDKAKGKWIIFIDSDDYVSKEYLATFLRYNLYDEETQVIQGFHVVDEYGNEPKNIPLPLIINSYEYGNIKISEYSELIGKYRLLHRHEIWGRTFSHKIIAKYHLRMDEEIHSYEDGIFWFEYLYHIANIIIVPERGYYYYYPQKSSSIMHTHKKNMDEIVKTLEHTKKIQQKILRTFDLRGKYREDFYRIFFNQYKHVYLNEKMNYKQALRLKKLRPISQDYIKDYKDLFFLLVNQLPFFLYLKITKHLVDNE